MTVRILHCADLHMDSPFESLPSEKAALMRSEQRELIMNIAETAKNYKVDLVFLAGDIFDSEMAYYETGEVLTEALKEIKVPVFIAPGNHDYYCSASPYAFLKFSDNVHIFRNQTVEAVELENVRVCGAAFTSPDSAGLLNGFSAPNDGKLNLAVLHGNVMGDSYNRITTENIASSGLDYLALGHIHACSGLCKAGNTFYAYPGCPQGRGFDETGDKGVIIADISKTQTKSDTEITFVPLAKRKYVELSCDITGQDVLVAAKGALGAYNAENIVRLTLAGEKAENANLTEVENELRDSVFALTVRDRTVSPRDLWEGLSEDTLRGSFLRLMNKKLETAEAPEEKEKILLAVRYGLAALENREESGI